MQRFKNVLNGAEINLFVIIEQIERNITYFILFAFEVSKFRIVVNNNIATVASIKLEGIRKTLINSSFSLDKAVQIVCMISIIFYNLQ